MRRPERALPPPIPEAAKRKESSLERAVVAKSETRVSKDHPRCNEDFSLTAEKASEPELHTADTSADLATIREAMKKVSENADALREREVRGLLDGTSASGRGEGAVAARIAAGAIAAHLGTLADDADAETSRRAIVEAIRAGHDAVIAHRGEREDLKSMATTADIVRVIDNGDDTYHVAYGHVGDGRIYILDGATGALRTETLDDGVAKYEMDRGEFTREEYDQVMDATSIDALPDKLRLAYKHRNAITRAVGKSEDFDVSSGIVTLKKGDKMLLSTDGIHDNLTKEQIADILRKGGGIKEIVAAAGAIADGGKEKNARAKMDDITGDLIEFGGAEELELDITVEDEDEMPAKKKASPPPITKAALKKSAADARTRDVASAKDVLRRIQEMIQEELDKPE